MLIYINTSKDILLFIHYTVKPLEWGTSEIGALEFRENIFPYK